MKNRRGFTLISVMIAVVIITIGLVALGRTQALVASSESDASVTTSALAVARAYMEEVRSRDPHDLESEPGTRVSLDGEEVAGGPFVRTLVVESEAANLLRVTVRIGTSRGRAPIELVTYVYKGTVTT